MNSTGIQIDDLNTTQPRGVCPHCKRGVGFRRKDRRTVFPELVPGRDTSGADFSGGTSRTAPRQPERRQVDEYVLECQLCGKTCVFFAYWGPDPSTWSDPPTSEELKKVKVMTVELVHPRQDARKLHEAAPAKMRDLFGEGARCEAVGALRAAAGMYRAAVEELCRDKQAAGNKLFDRIDGLSAQGVPPEIVADLHEARSLGNWSLHDGVSFSAEEVADVALLIEEAVTVVYVQPEERAAMRAARKARRDQHRQAQKN
ncbi:DUF4145 domain-containing protein [Streptomyces sp. NPDC101219]|uniref:DUF4145 domain-containing protein n=1 Tax=Streptomyces sp. NPDC101219 TaxID=3366131 RepID=UPI0037F72752